MEYQKRMSTKARFVIHRDREQRKAKGLSRGGLLKKLTERTKLHGGCEIAVNPPNCKIPA
jgi:hypothetical protein